MTDLQWKYAKTELPTADGEYLCYTGYSIKQFRFIDGKFYDHFWINSDWDDNDLRDRLRAMPVKQVRWWMEIPPIPSYYDRPKSWRESMHFCTKHQIDMLESIGIDSVEKLLATPRIKLFEIKGFKLRAFQSILNSMDNYDFPAHWGTNIECVRIMNYGHTRCEDICRLVLGIEAADIPRFRNMHFDSIDAVVLETHARADEYYIFMQMLRANPLYQGEGIRDYNPNHLEMTFSTTPEARKYYVEHYKKRD